MLTSSSASTVGNELCTDPTVRKVSVTGSTEVGKLIMKLSSGTLKKVSLELGGNAPFIVFDDADLDAAVQGAVAIEKCEDHIADAVSKGVRLSDGGKRHPLGGTFFEPTVLADANPQMKIAREEVFAAVPLRYRGAGDRHGQRHRVRPRLPTTSTPASSAASGGWRKR